MPSSEQVKAQLDGAISELAVLNGVIEMTPIAAEIKNTIEVQKAMAMQIHSAEQQQQQQQQTPAPRWKEKVVRLERRREHGARSSQGNFGGIQGRLFSVPEGAIIEEPEAEVAETPEKETEEVVPNKEEQTGQRARAKEIQKS